MTTDNPANHDGAAEQTEPGAEIPDVSLALNAVLEVLAHHHRRETLRVLINADNHTATISELASSLVARETEQTGVHPGRDEIEMQLHHIHLPKLSEAGIVEYDARSQELRYWRHDRLEDILEYVQASERN